MKLKVKTALLLSVMVVLCLGLLVESTPISALGVSSLVGWLLVYGPEALMDL